ALRYRRLKHAAAAYGLEHEPDLERYFFPTLVDGRLTIQPRLAGLLPLTSAKLQDLRNQAESHSQRQPEALRSPERPIVVINKHRYYRHITVELLYAGRTKVGKLKPPFTRVQPLSRISSAHDIDDAKFYAAIASVQQIVEGDRTASDLKALRAIVKYGASYPFYYHDDQLGETYASKTLVPVKTAIAPRTAQLSVHATGPFYAVTGVITINGRIY